MWRNEYITRTNYAINPAYRATSGTAIVRTNLCTNPSLGTVIDGWTLWVGFGSGAATRSWVNSADTPRGVAGYGRITWSAAPTSGGGLITGIVGIDGGTTYTFSIYIRPSVSLNVYGKVQWYNSGTPTTSNSTLSTPTNCPAGQWTRISITATNAATDNQYQFGAYVSGTGVTDTTTIDFDDCLVEATDTLQPYFDGSSSLNLAPNPQYATSNNSSLYPTTPDLAVSHTGSLGSIRSDPNGASSPVLSTYANGGLSTNTPCVPGVTYTASSWVYVQCGVACNANAKLVWRDAVPVATTVTGDSVTIPAGFTGWTQVSVSFTAPPTAATFYPIVQINRTTGDVVPGQDKAWVTDSMLEVSGSPIPGPFYQGLTPSWTGAPNASASVLTGVGNSANVLMTASVYNNSGGAGWNTGQNSYCVLHPKIGYASLILFSNTAAQSSNPGDYWAGRFEARVVPGSSTSDARITPNLYGYNSGSSTGIVTTSVIKTLPADGTWQSISVVSTAPTAANTTNIRWYIGGPNAAGNTPIIEVRNFILEKVSGPGVEAGPYFDGSTPSNPNTISYRWTGATDLSPSQQYLSQMVGPPQGLTAYSTSTAEHWFCDFYDLTNYAFGITKIENSTPEVRGDFTTIPQRNGAVARANRSYETGEFSLSMWVLGCDQDGFIPNNTNSSRRALFERNLSMLIKLLGAQNGPVTLTKLRYAPSSDINPSAAETITTRAICTGSTSIDTMMGRNRAEVVFTFTLIDSFWKGNNNTATGNSSSSYTANLINMGDAPVDDSIITINGPVASPVVTCPESGVSFKYSGNLTAGQTLVVNSADWTAKLNGVTDVIQNMSHTGHARLMYIPPRDVISVSLNPTVNFYPTVVLSGTGMTSSSSVVVTYGTKYQVA